MRSTSIIETAKTLGISAAKDQLVVELNKVFNNAVDAFDIKCLAEWMCNKGKLTSTTRSGIANFYDEENVLKCMAFERTLRTAAKAAKMETTASFKGLSEKILVNKLIATGAGFCDVVHDNDAFIRYQDEMEEKREKQMKRKRRMEQEKREREEKRQRDEAPWISYDGTLKNTWAPMPYRPPSPTYSPYRPPSPTYSPTDPPDRPLSPAYSPFSPSSPTYSPTDPPDPPFLSLN